jgi:hypothetical protein
VRGGFIGISTGYANELSDGLYMIESGRVRGGNWVTIERKEAMNLFESLLAHKFANFVYPLVVISNCQWVQAKMNVYAQLYTYFF